MIPKVVITRPPKQPDPLYQELIRCDREVMYFPLFEIERLKTQAEINHLKSINANLASFDYVAFVSPNAIQAWFDYVDDIPATIRFMVMGEGSRHVLLAHLGDKWTNTIFAPLDGNKMDSEALLAAMETVDFKNSRILIVRGQYGREILIDELTSRGAIVEKMTAYYRRQIEWNSSQLQLFDHLISSKNDWVVTSSEAFRSLQIGIELLGERNKRKLRLDESMLNTQRFFVPHVRIQQTALECGLKNCILTAPGDKGIVGALQSQL